MRTVKEASQVDFKKKAKPIARPVSSHPYSGQNKPDVALSQNIQGKKEI